MIQGLVRIARVGLVDFVSPARATLRRSRNILLSVRIAQCVSNFMRRNGSPPFAHSMTPAAGSSKLCIHSPVAFSSRTWTYATGSPTQKVKEGAFWAGPTIGYRGFDAPKQRVLLPGQLRTSRRICPDILCDTLAFKPHIRRRVWPGAGGIAPWRELWRRSVAGGRLETVASGCGWRKRGEGVFAVG